MSDASSSPHSAHSVYLAVQACRMDHLYSRHEDQCGGCHRPCVSGDGGWRGCPLIQWEAAAASFRHRARMLETIGARSYRAVITDAGNDHRIPGDFLDELRRQENVASHVDQNMYNNHTGGRP